jgi:hypothetical protein
MSSRLVALPSSLETSVYRMKHEMEFRDTMREIVLHPIRDLIPSGKPVMQTILSQLLGKDLSRFRMIDVGWYEARWRDEIHGIREDLEELYESDLRIQALSICR